MEKYRDLEDWLDILDEAERERQEQRKYGYLVAGDDHCIRERFSTLEDAEEYVAYMESRWGRKCHIQSEEKFYEEFEW